MSWKQPLEDEWFGCLVWLMLLGAFLVMPFVVARAAFDWIGEKVNA